MMTKSVRALILLFLLVFLSSKQNNVAAQENKDGYYLLKNYTRKDYNAHEQNWSAVKGRNGAMYFANNQNGVLEYDGNTWQAIPVLNNSMVRSLAVDSLGTVFVGAFGEFGFLAPNKLGKLTYHSLSKNLDSTYQNFQDIWNTYCIDDEVVFYSQKYIFKYKNFKLEEITETPQGSFLSFQFDKHILIGNYKIGILDYDWETAQLDTIKGSEIYEGIGKDINSIQPYGSNEYLVAASAAAEMSIFNTKALSKKQFNNAYLEKLLQTDFIYNALQIRKDYFFATISNDAGVFSMDRNGNVISRINKTIGLQENMVAYLYAYLKEEGQYPLWMTTVNGISKAYTNSPIKKLGQEIGLSGLVMDFIEFDNKRYIATFTGVYILDSENNTLKLTKIEGINRACWDLELFRHKGYEKLMAATDVGVYEINKDGTVEQFNKSDGSPFDPVSYSVKQSFYDQSKLNIAIKSGYSYFAFQNNTWEKLIENPKETEAFKYFAEITEDSYLFCSEFDGIWRVTNENSSHHYDTASGLPTLDYNKIYQFNKDEVLIATQKGIRYFDAKDNLFKPYNEIHSSYADGSKYVDLIYKDRFGNYWLNIIDGEKGNHLEKAVPIEGGYEIIEVPFRMLPNMSIQNIYTDQNNITWICGSDGLYSFDNNYKKNYDIDYQAVIRSVTVGEDSVIFNGTYFNPEGDSLRIVDYQTDFFKPILNYKNNNIKFTYAAPFFDKEEEIVYSHFLEGNDDDWSKWHSENFSIYTNLGEKKNYTFHVKAKNIYGKESLIATYNFRVLPPWQRTVWAFIAYGIISILVIYIIVKLNARRLIKEKERLEQIVRERTKEIRHQKEEIETQRDEIAAQRDTLEVLNQEIEKKNENITASIRYAERIQKAILPSDDYIKSLLPNSFVLFKPKDIVSGDFYFCDVHDDIVVFTAVDCTGHGVPGAFVSIVGSNWLTRALNEENLTKPSEIINYLSHGVYKTLQKDDDSKVKDGMDLSLVALDLKNMKGAWAGAYNPLYLYRKDEVIQFKADVFPVGSPFNERFNGYTNHEFDLEKGDALYVFSDGYIDQFGGPNRKKFMKKRFRELLGNLQDKSMEEQKQILNDTIDDWKKVGDSEQIDDILVFGVRI